MATQIYTTHNRLSQSPQRDVRRERVREKDKERACSSLFKGKGRRVRRIMGGPQRDSLEMETAL